MFVLCPHCQFLVALLANGIPPERCPRCDGSLQAGAPTVAETVAGVASGGAATAADGMDGATVAPAAESTATAHDRTSQAAGDGPAVATDADAIDDTMPGSAATQGEVELATATAPPASPPLDTHRAGASTATPEAGGAGPVEAQAVPAQSEPQDVPAAQAEPDGHSPEPAADAAPSSLAAKKARNPKRPAIPSFARAVPTAKPVDRRRFRLESAAIAVLSLLLAVQWLLADRVRLAADARWRPLLSTLCGVLGCDLPAWREPLAFTLVERDVRPHPRRAGALRVTATFRNDARWPQPWPGVLLTLSDIDGQVAGARVFTAREYLDATPTQNELGSGQTASIAMDVVEPTPRIVAFTFDFR